MVEDNIVVGDAAAKGVKTVPVAIDASGNITAVTSLDSPGLIAGSTFNSDVAIGTQPYVCTSTTKNTNMNADLLDDMHVGSGTGGDAICNLNGILNHFSSQTTIRVDNAKALNVEEAGSPFVDIFTVNTLVPSVDIGSTAQLIIDTRTTVAELNIAPWATATKQPPTGALWDVYIDDGSNTASGTYGWRICTSAGTPGTWGDISAGPNKTEFTANSDPHASTDVTDGFLVGSVWVNLTLDRAWICVDNTEDAAVWWRIDNSDTRQRKVVFEYVTPLTGGDFLLDSVPVGATITRCWAVCDAATEIKFGIVMRDESDPWLASGETIIVDIATEEATTTGGTKTLASTTYTANKVLRLLTGAVTGTPGILYVALTYTID